MLWMWTSVTCQHWMKWPVQTHIHISSRFIPAAGSHIQSEQSHNTDILHITQSTHLNCKRFQKLAFFQSFFLSYLVPKYVRPITTPPTRFHPLDHNQAHSANHHSSLAPSSPKVRKNNWQHFTSRELSRDSTAVCCTDSTFRSYSGAKEYVSEEGKRERD